MPARTPTVGLLLCAHGSRDPRLPRHFARLARTIDLPVPVAFGFLELSAPSIEDAAAALVARGADRLALFPLFLAPGRHLAQDLPRRARALCARLGVPVRVLPYLGGQPELVEAICRAAARLLRQSSRR